MLAMYMSWRHTKKISPGRWQTHRGIYFSSLKQNCLTGDKSRIRRILNQNYFVLQQTFNKTQLQDIKGNPITAQMTQGILKTLE